MTVTPAGSAAASARAAIIYADARSVLDARLWQAALGRGGPEQAVPQGTAGLDLSSLLALIGAEAAPARPAARPPSPPSEAAAIADGTPHGATIAKAADRTGLPAAALASIIDAEAAHDGRGGWLTASRNPRSSAAGLGQFLAGTWVAEAERAGTWLHAAARANGWLGVDGGVLPGARAALLALRDDAGAAIEATADYARANLDRLARAGVAVGAGTGDIAHAAYVGHHLGAGDAIRFLRGELGEGRARLLLAAQIGSQSAESRIAAAGSAVAAHRNWLADFVGRRVRPDRFGA